MSNLLSSVNIYIFVKEVTLQTFSDGGHLCICTVFQMGDTCVSVLFFRWGTLVYLYCFSDGGHLCICTDIHMGGTWYLY